ncbi:MAG: RtcB family protein [Thermomicrobiales bacterium]
MYQTITAPDLKAPIKTWLPIPEIESGAREQLENAARHPDVGPHVAVMPDCHVGFGVTIGCVFPTVDAILPTAVGVDIACGMCAVPTGRAFDRATMDARFWGAWADKVRGTIPTGFGTRKRQQRWSGFDVTLRAKPLQSLIREKAAIQLGTLGGGNHFLEAQVDEDGQIWLMVHSGSRHTGLRIADFYTERAKTISALRGQKVPRELWALPLDDQVAHDYLHDMEWATRFALESRYQMLEGMLHAFGMEPAEAGGRAAFINIHHNFVRIEEHFGQRLVVHRKGATSAQDGEIGIIPGSMGAPSFIVRGKGSPDSFASCSHGAGRVMGRKQAKRTIDEDALREALVGTFTRPSRGFLDEAPQVYKDVTRVIARQTDLVDVVHTLKPIVTVKGDSKAKDD